MRRNPATLAENATGNVFRILHRDRAFNLTRTIDLETAHEGPYYLVAYPPLGIQGRGKSELEALESFADQFSAMWEWIARADDAQLVPEARKLKREMLKLVQSVEPAA